MSRERLGEGALQGGLVIQPAVRGEHVLDRLLQQGTQPFDDRLPRHVRTQPSGLISSPRPKSTSVSPATTVRWLSIQSTMSFGRCPGNASTPTSSRSPAAYRCASPIPSLRSHTTSGLPSPACSAVRPYVCMRYSAVLGCGVHTGTTSPSTRR